MVMMGPTLKNSHCWQLFISLLVISPVSSMSNNSLFFSAYIEGSGQNKAYSIYNPTGIPINLNQYAVRNRVNFDFNKWYNFTNNAVLRSGEDYVICQPSANSEILAVCNEARTYMHTGNDAYQLVRCADSCGSRCDELCTDYEVIDMIGNFTSVNIGAWDVCGIAGATQDHTLIRAASVCEGADWAVSSDENTCQWTVGAKDTGFDEIGFHTTDGCIDDGGRSTGRPSSAPVVTPTIGVIVEDATMCPSAPASPQDRRSDKSVLKVAQWNMDFLMLPHIKTTGSFQCPCEHIDCADTSCSDCSNCCGWGRVESRAHLRYVALEMMKLDADIIHVAEVGDCGVLLELLALLPEGHGYIPYMVENKDTFTGQHVGLITRVDPIEDLVYDTRKVPYPVDSSNSEGYHVVAHPSECALNAAAGSGNQGVTKNLKARLWPEGLDAPISIIGLHLLAVPDGADRCGKREAQAHVAAIMAAQSLAAGDEVIVIGDMNDFDNIALQQSQVEPVTNVLAILRNGSTPPMRNVIELIPQEERYSEWWDRNNDCYDPGSTTDPYLTEHSQLDHILLSASLWDRIIEGSAAMRHDWTPGCMKDGGLFSDHWPLTVNLNTSTENDEGGDEGGDDDDTGNNCSDAKLERANTAVVVMITLTVASVLVAFVLLAMRMVKRGAAFSRAALEEEDDTGVVMSSMHADSKYSPKNASEGLEF